MDISVNADLFRSVYIAVSTEETRYYLQGVFIEPMPNGGVTMAATDGHRLLVCFDPSGAAARAAIIRLSKDALKACKPVKGDTRRLGVAFDAETATVWARKHEEAPELPVAISPGAEIDGTFPQWRRVVPAIDGPGGQPGFFNSRYLAEMGNAGEGFASAAGRGRPPMTLYQAAEGDPALIRWASVEDAFGVLMPVRAAPATIRPAWL